MIIQEEDSLLEKIINILENSKGFENIKNWPPYPESFEIPQEIKNMWMYKQFNAMGSVVYMPVLKGNFRDCRGLHVQDQFNGVVIQRKRKKGVHYPNRFHRTPQMLFPPYGLSGEIIFEMLFNKSLSGAEILEKGELRTGEVHRFEVVHIEPEKHVYYCVPLKHVFNRNNLLYNLTNFNYKPFLKTSKQNI